MAESSQLRAAFVRGVRAAGGETWTVEEAQDAARLAYPPLPAAEHEVLPWEIRVPRSAVVGDVSAESSCHVYVEDGQHWMQERDGSCVPLIILRADRVRIVDDAATDLADEGPALSVQRSPTDANVSEKTIGISDKP